MDAEQFVSIVHTLALEGAVRSAEANLLRPPGRAPAASLLDLSRWYNSLTVEDQARARQLLRLAARYAVHSVLAILDGAQAIESGPEKGRLELRYVKGNSAILFNDMDQVPLNDLLGP